MIFVDPLNMEELITAIANTSNTRSFDTDGIHLSVIKKMGYIAREMFPQTFNNSWETASLPWIVSRVIIGEKQVGFRMERNTVRLQYRLHLSLDRAKAAKSPTAMLNIH